jgi:hypothetical protein
MRRVGFSALAGAPWIAAAKTPDETAVGPVGEGAAVAAGHGPRNSSHPDSHRHRGAMRHRRSGLPTRRLDTAPP